MRKLTPKRLISLFLALLMLTGSGSVAVMADSSGSRSSDLADKDSWTIDEKRELLYNTRPYDDYLKRYANVAAGTANIEVDITKVDSKNANVSDISKYPNVYVTPWFKIASEADLESILEKLDCDSYEIVYDYPDEAQKENRKHFYIKYTKNIEGTDPVVELTDTGSVTFKVNVPTSGMYSINMEYYPMYGKSANIERMLFING